MWETYRQTLKRRLRKLISGEKLRSDCLLRSVYMSELEG